MKLKTRNDASTLEYIHMTGSQPLWTDWTVEKAVKDGYKVNPWVYKAVNLNSKAGASIPFAVFDKDNEIIPEHPISLLLLNPHPVLSRVQFFEIIWSWLELAGAAYIKIAEATNSVAELHPISPDRLRPIESKDNSIFLDGYAYGNEQRISQEYTTDNVIRLVYNDPSNPLLGVSPLQACSKAVDIDSSMQDWNKSTMQDKGVVDGVFTFDEEIDEEQSRSLTRRLLARIADFVKAPLVIGSKAKYTRMSLTPEEADFSTSRTANRDEIFVTFGIPPQLGGALDASTYNNFQVASRIHLETKILPVNKMIATQLTNSLKEYLREGEYIASDLSGVDALNDNQKEKAEIVKIYADAGVPLDQISEKFELGFDIPEQVEQPEIVEPEQVRSRKTDKKKLNKAEKDATKLYESFFKKQEAAVLQVLEADNDPTSVIDSFGSELEEIIYKVTKDTASQFTKNLLMRGQVEDDLIDKYLTDEEYILIEKSLIQGSTLDEILQQIADASEKGYNFMELKQAISDTGTFSPFRASRIARTEVGAASSIGQFAAAIETGAKTKTWNIVPNQVRDLHKARAGETVGINEKFSGGAMFPLDPHLSAADRVNCKCYMTFGV